MLGGPLLELSFLVKEISSSARLITCCVDSQSAVIRVAVTLVRPVLDAGGVLRHRVPVKGPLNH